MGWNRSRRADAQAPGNAEVAAAMKLVEPEVWMGWPYVCGRFGTRYFFLFGFWSVSIFCPLKGFQSLFFKGSVVGFPNVTH